MRLVSLHIFLISLSNILVQFPFTLGGFHTTYGAFSYPLIFILSDLTTRLYGARPARLIILKAMLPALIISYIVSSISLTQAAMPHAQLLALRVAFASFAAYVLGQLLDITVFDSLRRHQRWYLAPLLSNTFGNVFDTLCFFFLAFYQSHHPFMRIHWFDVAMVDLLVKCFISCVAFVPLYGVVLRTCLNQQARSPSLIV